MSIKTCYLFDEVTGESKGYFEAQESPLEEGAFIVPEHSTDIQPPSVSVNQVAVFVNGAWTIVPDFRAATVYDQTTGAVVEVTVIGALEANLGLSKPDAMLLSEAHKAQAYKIERNRDSACAENATALGHIWQADAKSVSLLNGAITLAQAGLPLPPAWRTADNVNVPISSVADLLAIAGAIAAQTQAAYAKSWTLKAQVAAAPDIATVEAITW